MSANFKVRPYPDWPGKFQIYDAANEKNFALRNLSFKTVEAAAAYAETTVAWWDFGKQLDILPREFSRTDYEAACQQFSVTPQADSEVDGYGTRYYEFNLSGFSPEQYPQILLGGKQNTLNRRRLEGIKAERKATQPVTPAPRPIALTLCDCGHETAHPMTASLGSACPDCYDRMSN